MIEDYLKGENTIFFTLYVKMENNVVWVEHWRKTFYLKPSKTPAKVKMNHQKRRESIKFKFHKLFFILNNSLLNIVVRYTYLVLVFDCIQIMYFNRSNYFLSIKYLFS